jgi:hypothetical protein
MHWTDLMILGNVCHPPPRWKVQMALDHPDPRLDPRVETLVLDLVEWVAREPRTYAEVMDAWRTSCPRLAVWEEAVDRGLLVREAAPGGVMVRATPAGRRLLEAGMAEVQH